METTRPNYITAERMQHFIREALKEDIGDGDHSTLASVPATLQRQAQLLIKQDCILAGVELATEIFKYYDSSLEVEVRMKDGAVAKKGDVALIVSGSAQSILTVERFVLNCMQRMSGIASYANQAVKLLANTNTQILDTRKTSPNFRMCEKWAVHIGGAQNHRFGLFDMIMLKDNHVDYARGLRKAVESTVNYLKANSLDLQIEVETRNLKEVQEALDTKCVDIIMLDNMSISEMAEAVKLIGKQAKTEASGGVTNDMLQEIAKTGVNYISSGAIIYAAPIADMSLKAI